MAYNLTRVEKEFNEICGRAGTPVTCPIRLNGRLKRTLGRVTITRQANSRSIPTLVEFSKQLLETCTDDTIWNVIAHEASHYIATARTGESHGHDNYFRSICAEVGTTNDGTTTKVERTVDPSAIYKYTVVCIDCNSTLGYYHRMSKNLKNIHLCTCGKCGSSNLAIIHN